MAALAGGPRGGGGGRPEGADGVRAGLGAHHRARLQPGAVRAGRRTGRTGRRRGARRGRRGVAPPGAVEDGPGRPEHRLPPGQGGHQHRSGATFLHKLRSFAAVLQIRN